MCKVTVTTNHLCVWYTCEDCNVTLQNPIPRYPVEWLNNHAAQQRVEQTADDPTDHIPSGDYWMNGNLVGL